MVKRARATRNEIDDRRWIGRPVIGGVAILIGVIITSAAAAVPQRAAGGLTRAVDHAAEVFFAQGKVKATQMGTQTVQVPLDIVNDGTAGPTNVDVLVAALMLNFDGDAPQVFTSMSVELQRNGVAVTQRSTPLKKNEGGASIEFDNVEVEASDQLSALITFQGEAIRDTLVALNAAVALASR